MVGIKHNKVTAIADDPAYDVSADEWNEAHVIDPGTIVNADIANAAAIDYAKLNLDLSIVNADIAAAAAIAYSKLNLALSVVNADVANAAAIAYSKLNLANSIVNADVAAGAAILESKLALNYATHAAMARGATKVVGFSADCDYVCDGVADDVQIQQAITAVAALGGGTVVLQRGTYDSSATVNGASEVDIIGQGYDTLLQHSGVAHAILTFTNCDYCLVSRIRFDCADNVGENGISCLVANTYINVKDCYFIDCDYGLGLNFGDYCQVSGNVFYSCASGSINAVGNYGVYVSNIAILQSTKNGFVVGGSYNALEANYIEGQSGVGEYGFSVSGSSNTFLGNITRNCGSSGFYISGSSNAVISNAASNCAQGFYLSGTGNSAIGNAVNVTTVGAGIYSLGITKAVIVGNTVYDTKTDGIKITTGTSVIINNNLIDSPDNAGASTYHGITATTLTDSLIENNIVKNTDAHNVKDGIKLATNCTDNIIVGNRVMGYDTGINISNSTCSRTVVQHNVLLNNTACFADVGTDTKMHSVQAPFSDGNDAQDIGWLINAAAEYARAWLVLPQEVQQVVRMKIVAVAAVAETHGMLADITIYGGDYSLAGGELYTTHGGVAASQVSTTQNFIISDVIYWIQTPAGLLALLGKDSVQVKILHRVADATNCQTNAYFRTVEIEYV